MSLHRTEAFRLTGLGLDGKRPNITIRAKEGHIARGVRVSGAANVAAAIRAALGGVA